MRLLGQERFAAFHREAASERLVRATLTRHGAPVRQAPDPQHAPGLLLGLFAIQPAFAVDWGSEVRLSSANTSDHELVRTGPRSALVLWDRGDAIVIRRTTDGGRTWLPSQTLSTGIGLDSSVAAVGSRVHVVHVRSVTCPDDGQLAWRLFHRRSLDGGATWRAPVALTSACSEVAQADVARSSDGQVSVAWVALFTGRILMRTWVQRGAP